MKQTYRPSVLMRFNAAVTVSSVVLVLVWSSATGFQLPPFSQLLPMAIVAGAFMLAGLFYAFVRVDDRVARAMLSIAIMQVFISASGVLSYLGATLQFPMADAMFVAIDRAMGFDWIGLVHWAQDKPVLIEVAGFLYDKPFSVLPFAVIVLLVFTNRGDRFEEMIGFVIISTSLTLVIGSLIPGISAFAYFDIPAEISAKIGTSLDHTSGQAYFAIRNGIDNRIDLANPRALIAFPSYHTVVAVMLSLYVRHNRYLLAAMIPVSVGIILSTPLIGGHYLIDTLGGIALAFVAFRLVQRLVRMSAPVPASAPGLGGTVPVAG
jgi:membrane-associated phospholipid phosphatase